MPDVVPLQLDVFRSWRRQLREALSETHWLSVTEMQILDTAGLTDVQRRILATQARHRFEVRVSLSQVLAELENAIDSLERL
jgi:hypothetical protein